MATYFVYLLQSLKNGKFYTGYTLNLQKRLKDHNLGKNYSTKPNKPFKIIYYEACLNKLDTIAREKYLKSGMGKRYLRNRLKNY